MERLEFVHIRVQYTCKILRHRFVIPSYWLHNSAWTFTLTRANNNCSPYRTFPIKEFAIIRQHRQIIYKANDFHLEKQKTWNILKIIPKVFYYKSIYAVRENPVGNQIVLSLKIPIEQYFSLSLTYMRLAQKLTH